MHAPRPSLVALSAGALAAVLVACGGAAPTPQPTQASPQSTAAVTPFFPVAGRAPTAGTPWFLAAGDSITAGFSLDPKRFGVNSSWALQLQGLLATSGRHWQLYDTACVSETAQTYFTMCPGREQTPPFLQHTSQQDADLAAITAHGSDLRAIFVDLGSNDLLSALRDAVPAATAIAQLRDRLTRITGELHAAAPRVPVIIANYYDPFSNLDPATRAQTDAADAMVAAVAQTVGARVADFHAAFNTVTTGGGTDAQLCRWVDCADGDIHPTVAGHARLAQAALAALDAA